jgi:hypothetical protein
VTWNDHRRARFAELWRTVAARKRIYLDTRYWVFLRDAAMGRTKHPVHDDLLAILQRLVASGAAICPLSDSAMFELHKQTDPDEQTIEFELEIWRRRPDLNRGWRFCRFTEVLYVVG